MRTTGITMLLRLKNEEEWIEPCLRSVAWADKLVMCFQNSTDRTEEICRDVVDSAQSAFYHYPHDSRPNGPGHNNQPYDKFNRAYFYNWCYEKTHTKYVVKWDGDMVAHQTLEDIMREKEDQYNFVSIFGTNIVIKDGVWYTNKNDVYCGTEPRLFRARDKNPWKTGKMCEVFAYPIERDAFLVKTPQFLHFKYGKNVESMTAAWPDGWEEQEHFQMLFKRGHPEDPNDLQPYEGPIPSCLQDS